MCTQGGYSHLHYSVHCKRTRLDLTHWFGPFTQMWIHTNESWCRSSKQTETHFLRWSQYTDKLTRCGFASGLNTTHCWSAPKTGYVRLFGLNKPPCKILARTKCWSYLIIRLLFSHVAASKLLGLSMQSPRSCGLLHAFADTVLKLRNIALRNEWAALDIQNYFEALITAQICRAGMRHVKKMACLCSPYCPRHFSPMSAPIVTCKQCVYRI